MFLGPLVSMFGNKKILSLGAAKPNKKDHTFLKELLEKNIVKPVIERQYPLSELPEAISYVEKGHTRGKVVINIGNETL
jgi:NADPH:quinone reductase-like Zn-dependent oxidoreductase